MDLKYVLPRDDISGSEMIQYDSRQWSDVQCVHFHDVAGSLGHIRLCLLIALPTLEYGQQGLAGRDRLPSMYR